jgi:translation initiation factor 2B subunit (eIF-2B alpha/beta/delta family)
VPSTQAPELADIEKSLFELVPADLVTEVVTEEGTFPADETMTLVDRVPFLSEGYQLVIPVKAG